MSHRNLSRLWFDRYLKWKIKFVDEEERLSQIEILLLFLKKDFNDTSGQFSIKEG